MNTKTLIALLAVAAVITFVGVTFPRPLPTTNVTNTTLGATSGTDVSGCFSINGVETCSTKQTMRTATTTICSLRSPTYATSSLITGFAQFATASTTQALQVTVTRSENAYATSTGARILVGLATTTLTADITGNSVSFNATNTYPTVGENLTDLIAQDRIFGPGEYIVVGLAGGQHVSSATPTGSCSASFQVQ